MKKLFLIVALCSGTAMANGPKYSYPTPRGLDDEVRNIYHDIQTTRNPALSYTLTQLKTYPPAQAGILVYCSDCAVSAICVSTGTTVFGFSDISGRTTACH